MNKLNELQEKLDLAKVEAEKFDKGNKAAGTRLRALMQDIKAGAQAIRIDVQERKKA